MTTTRQRIAQTIETLCGRIDSNAYPADSVAVYAEAVGELSRALERLPEDEIPEGVDLDGTFGEWTWELGHGSETVVLTIRDAAYRSSTRHSPPLATQSEPEDAMALAEALAHQARAVLELQE